MADSTCDMRHSVYERDVKPEGRVMLGDLLASIGCKVKLTDEQMAIFRPYHSPARAASFE